MAVHGLRWVQDDDPYVRKTAAVCVAKLFDINPELVDDRGFIEMLRVSTKMVHASWTQMWLTCAAGTHAWHAAAAACACACAALSHQGFALALRTNPHPTQQPIDGCGSTHTAQEMLSDANPIVVANALAALQEIQEISGRVSPSHVDHSQPEGGQWKRW